MQLNLTHLTYTYPGATAAALEEVTLTLRPGWTGIVGDNGCGKTTLALIACGKLRPDAGAVGPRLFSVYCAQDPDVEPDTLANFASDWNREAQDIRRRLAIEDDWLWRYDTLSGGQKKRIQIACALWERPDVLVMDEPTNDLDGPTRVIVADALAAFGGIGILISHDRALLDSLVSQCLMYEAGRFVLRPGTYTQASGQASICRETAMRSREQTRREVQRMEAEAARRREEASRAKGKRSARHLDPKDHDGRGRIQLAIYTGKDGVAGKLASSMDGRLARARQELAANTVEKRYDGKIGNWGARSRASVVLHRKEGTLQAGDFSLRVPELWVGPADHVVLTGANGSGKSLLVSDLMGRVRESVNAAFLPQDVSAATRERALAKLAALPAAEKGRVLSIVGRLNSDPDALLDGADMSPGETKKLMLAEQLVENPEFIVLDEPTNHLDMGSIEALGELLSTFPGAFLLVTHDKALADSLDAIHWRTERDGEGSALVVG